MEYEEWKMAYYSLTLTQECTPLGIATAAAGKPGPADGVRGEEDDI